MSYRGRSRQAFSAISERKGRLQPAATQFLPCVVLAIGKTKMKLADGNTDKNGKPGAKWRGLHARDPTLDRAAAFEGDRAFHVQWKKHKKLNVSLKEHAGSDDSLKKLYHLNGYTYARNICSQWHGPRAQWASSTVWIYQHFISLPMQIAKVGNPNAQNWLVTRFCT